MKRPSDLGRSFSCWTEPRGGIGDSGRGPHVGHQMFAVSGQRDQAVRAAGSHEDHGDGAVDGGPDHRNASPTPTFSNGSGLRKRTTEVHRMNAAATKIMMPSIAAEVLGLVADGRSNAQVADVLAVSGKPSPTTYRRCSAPSRPRPDAPRRAGQHAAAKPSTRVPDQRRRQNLRTSRPGGRDHQVAGHGATSPSETMGKPVGNTWGTHPTRGERARQAEAAPAAPATHSPLPAAPHMSGHRKGERFSPPAFSSYLPLSEALCVRERRVEALFYQPIMTP